MEDVDISYVGSLATSVVDPWTLLCGASGGCYALIGAHFAIIIMVCSSLIVHQCFVIVQIKFPQCVCVVGWLSSELE